MESATLPTRSYPCLPRQSGAAQPTSSPPPASHIVKFTSRSAPGGERACTSLDEALDFAVAIVRDGEAHPDSVVVYANTEIAIRVSVNHPAQEAKRG